MGWTFHDIMYSKDSYSTFKVLITSCGSQCCRSKYIFNKFPFTGVRSTFPSIVLSLYVVFRTDRSVIRRNQDWSGVEKSFFAIISRSTGPISAIFFLLWRGRRALSNKKKIAEIGSLDREIIFFGFGSGRVESGFSADPIRIRSENSEHYLDDILIMASSKDLVIQHAIVLITSLQNLGLTINKDKSLLVPS